MKKLLVILAILIAPLVHVGYLIKVSKNEVRIKKEKRHFEEIQKEYEKKQMEYDSLLDLDKIGKEMEKKHNMSISKKINFFKIGKKLITEEK